MQSLLLQHWGMHVLFTLFTGTLSSIYAKISSKYLKNSGYGLLELSGWPEIEIEARKRNVKFVSLLQIVI